MKVIKYNKFNFINENSEFSNGQVSDPSISMNQYSDAFSRSASMVKDIFNISMFLRDEIRGNNQYDAFIEDLEEYTNFKILRIIQNQTMNLDVFISFNFNDDEFFGVYRNFNTDNKAKLTSDLLTDPRFPQITHEYYIKLNSYIRNILTKWFTPKKGDYITLKDGLRVIDSMGNYIKIPKNTKFTIKLQSTDQNNEPYLIVSYKDQSYKISSNDYYYFKYRTEPI